jgi:predicted NUDIX family NTP pyrophosphohydrolase
MKKQSSGLLIYRQISAELEVLLVHPGGPFWAKKDKGAWGVPKGEYETGDDPLVAARREFEEEIGQPAPKAETIELGEMKRQDGKVIKVWAVEGHLDVSVIKSNNFTMEWPPKSGNMQDFPEVDAANWFKLSEAVTKLHKGQAVFIERLANQLNIPYAPETVPEPPQQNSLF